MVWYWARSRRGRHRREGRRRRCRRGREDGGAGQARRVTADAGLLFQWGALDFAGGTVVHINAGIAGLVGALMIGKRIGYGKELIAPHSLTMTMIGASLLWVGWFGFNAGSNLEANGTTALAMINTFVATAAARPVLALRRVGARRASPRCSASSRARSPASSRSRRPPASPVRWARSSSASSPAPSASSSARRVKNALGYDDSLDVFGIHCVGGIVGALGDRHPRQPGAAAASGVADYVTKPGELVVADYVFAAQSGRRSRRSRVTLLWSGIGSAILYKIVDLIVGLRVTQDEEREGLDLADHGERAYNY